MWKWKLAALIFAAIMTGCGKGEVKPETTTGLNEIQVNPIEVETILVENIETEDIIVETWESNSVQRWE